MMNELSYAQQIALDIINSALAGERLMIDFGELELSDLRVLKVELSRQVARINTRIIDLRTPYSEQVGLARERELLETALRQIHARIYEIEIAINESRS